MQHEYIVNTTHIQYTFNNRTTIIQSSYTDHTKHYNNHTIIIHEADNRPKHNHAIIICESINNNTIINPDSYNRNTITSQ